MGYIYKIENTINGKIYIGKTDYFDVTKRWKEHKRAMNREDCKHRPLYRAFNKYGIENFKFSVIEETNNTSEREVYWINFYDAYNNGYNLTLGGDGRSYVTIDIDNCRITRDSLKTTINVRDNILQEIIVKKEKLFAKYLVCTQPLPALFILQHLKNTYNVLLTYARRERAKSVLEYYGVTSLFENFYCRDSYSGKSKFGYLVNELHYPSDKIILFENDQEAIASALHFGIPNRNIYKS